MKKGVVVFILFLIVLGIMPIINPAFGDFGDDGFIILPPPAFPPNMDCTCSASTSLGGSLDLNGECNKATDGDLDTSVGGPGYYSSVDPWGSITTQAYRYELDITFDKSVINNIEIIPGECFNSGTVYVYDGGILKKQWSLYLYGNKLSFENINATWVKVKWSGATYCTNSNLKEVTIRKISDSDCSDSDGGVDGEQEFIEGIAEGALDSSETDQCRAYTWDAVHRKPGMVYWTDGCKTGDGVIGGYVYVCNVKEAYCEAGIAKTREFTCPSGSCYNGSCGCEEDNDCAPGYLCDTFTYLKPWPPETEGELMACRLISCNDTDGGIEKSIPGTITSEINQLAGADDFCIDGDTVFEYYCSLGRAESQQIDCNYPQEVCKDGACVVVTCGDGNLEGIEECDDGNTNNQDGCSSNCEIETCESFKSNSTCLQFGEGESPQGEKMNCTWTPSTNTERIEIDPITKEASPGSGYWSAGCCAEDYEWKVLDNECAETEEILCTYIFNRLDEEFNKDNAYGPGVLLAGENSQYCAQVAASYGFWRPIEVY